MPRNSLAVKEAADILVRSGANSVVMGSVYGASAALIREMRSRNSRAFFASVSFIGTSSLFDALSNEAKGVGITQVMPNPFTAATPWSREFQAAMKASDDGKLSYGAMEGYVAARVFTEAVKRAGAGLTRQKLIASLESFDALDIGGFVIRFSANNHNGSSFTAMTVLGANRTISLPLLGRGGFQRLWSHTQRTLRHDVEIQVRLHRRGAMDIS